jgi:DNA polymerase-3 subunit beta
VPRKTIGMTVDLAEGGAELVRISLSTQKITFEIGQTRVTSKLIDGTFPDYMRVIPAGNNDLAVLSRNDFADSADRVATIASDKGRAVKLSFAAGAPLILAATNPDAGAATDEVDVDYDGPGLDIGFNARYLADILRQLEGEKCQLAMLDPGAPAIFSPVGDASALFILMPMRV